MTTAATPDPRQAILAALRNDQPQRPAAGNPPGNFDLITEGYRRAVIAACRSIEETATEAELSHAGVDAGYLTPAHNIGEHLAATRRVFGLVP